MKKTSYATNNTYIGFYRVVHEAKYPSDDVPPLPHSSTWFSHLEGSNASRGSVSANRANEEGGGRAEAEDDEIEIERERISLKCPLTLLPFQQPVTSKKCPHSFEKNAIHDMIQRSSFTAEVPDPAARSGSSACRNSRPPTRRVRAVKCPVCTVVLTSNDFVLDVALLRRVKRAEAATQREVEDDLDAVTGSKRRRSRKSGITLASDGASSDDNNEEEGDDEGRRVRTKREETDVDGGVEAEQAPNQNASNAEGNEGENEEEDEDENGEEEEAEDDDDDDENGPEEEAEDE